MRIAPIDIAHKQFAKKLMGLDSNEVIEFLRDVADQMEEVIRERNSLKETAREKEIQIMEYKERDETLKATITTATKMSEQIRVDAEREAKLILNDAHQKAEMIIKDARDSLKRIYQEISEMKRSRIQFEASLRSLVHGHLAMLDQGHNILPEIHPPNMQQHTQQAVDRAVHAGNHANGHPNIHAAMTNGTAMNAAGVNFANSNQGYGGSGHSNQTQPQQQLQQQQRAGRGTGAIS